MTIQRALLSVSDKTDLVPFAKFLETQGVELISTGGTARVLTEAGIKVLDISEVTEFPEMLDGRVKTLHPKIHGGILFIRGNDSHEKTITEHQIGAIDLVVVNLYPFQQTVASGADDATCIENIDIGGPSMLRSAAKNHAAVTVVTEVSDYQKVIDEIKQNGDTTLETRRRLAGKVFKLTGEYDTAIANYFGVGIKLKYGENPHQKAELVQAEKVPNSLAHAEQLQGKQMGYCNYLDADGALALISSFAESKPTCAIIKHATPCGVAQADDLLEAYICALAADSTSAFGGIVAFNGEVNAKIASKLTEMFLEVIIAPDFTQEAQTILAEKKNLRLLKVGKLQLRSEEAWQERSIWGGKLRQTYDYKQLTTADLKVVVGDWSEEEKQQAIFAWQITKAVASNAIVLAKDFATVGIGGGQTSRVGAAEIAIRQAGDKAKGSIVASDAFFPFADSIESLAKAGVSAIIQPGGSMRDSEVIAAAEKAGIKMVFTGTRAFRH